MTTEDTILIEKYLKGLLSSEECQLFEERLKTDDDFRADYTLEKQLNASLNEDDWNTVSKDNPNVVKYRQALKSEGFENLKTSLLKMNSEMNSNPKKSVKMWYYLAAASILVFVGFQLFFNQRVSNQDLYYANIELNELPSFVTRINNTEIQPKLVKGEQQFKKGNYKEALQLFEENLEEGKRSSLLFIYTGLAQMELGLFKESENTFNDLIGNKSQDADIAYWYKSLLYLKEEKPDKALELLSKITQNKNGRYYHKALKLAKSITDINAP